MKDIKKLLTGLMKPTVHNALVVALVIFIIVDTNIPHDLQRLVNEPIVKVVLLSGCLYLTLQKPVLGCLSLIVLYELTTRKSSFNLLDDSGVSFEEHKEEILRELEENKKKVTLEEEIVGDMVPYYKDRPEQSEVEPVLTNQLKLSTDL